MKTTVFELMNMGSEPTATPFDEQSGVYDIPTLPAFAILHTSLDFGSSYVSESFIRPTYEIESDRLIISPMPEFWGLRGDVPKLTVTYSGIRNYTLLFPHVTCEGLKVRLGEFAEEAEKAFDASAWMSFVLMAGAVIEGLLVSRFGNNKKFFKLIKLAGEAGLVTETELESLDEVREARNRVHADQFGLPFVGRQLAMDVYVIYDRFLKRRWDLDK